MAAESFVKVRILVVDDDSICLSVIAACLRTLKYEVAMAKHPFDALSILRERRQAFDLVMSDFHMPNMTGLELQKIVREEFDLPVVIMSADDSEAVILHCLHSGASFYIVKPVNPNDLKNVWQYVVSKKKDSSANSVTIEDIDNVQGTSSKDRPSPNQNHEKSESTISTVVAKKVKKKAKKKKDSITNQSKTDQMEGGGKACVIDSNSKSKVIWTDDLHHRFLQAIDCLGWENAIPTRINDLMNVQGLTRENIASHLQKYRIFLRKVSHSGVDKLRDPKVASRLGVAPKVLSTIVEQRFPPKNLHSSQQLYDHLVKLRGNTPDQTEEIPKHGNDRPPLSVTGEATTVISSDQRRHLALPGVATGNHSRNGGCQNEEALGSTTGRGRFVILDSSHEVLPDQGNVNNFTRQINAQSHFPSGDNGEDRLLTVIKSFDHLGTNGLTNIPTSGVLTDIVGDTSLTFNRCMMRRPVNHSSNLEAPSMKNPMGDCEYPDQDWADFMDSLWRSNDDFWWD